MSGVKDSFLDLERHRAQLEDNIKGLKKAINHWRTWDLEYEALKEEVEAVLAEDNDASQAVELRRIQDGFEGELLDKDEVAEIFGKPRLRTTSQITNILDRRIDYVTKNIGTLSKQLETVENKHAAATVISQPDATDEEGQPITDIVEQLDDDDNVLSYRLMQPGDSLPQVREALGKAGLKELEREPQSAGGEASGSQADQESQRDDAASSLEAPASAQPEKKAVTFAEDTKAAADAPPSPQLSRAAKRVTKIMEDAKAQENWAGDAPVIPDDEDPEDAALRQEMLRYSMGEVGAVVAELQLEEMGSEDEEMEDFGYSDEEDDVDDEDQYGRSKGSVVTDDYRSRMMELEKKLGIRSRVPDSVVKTNEDEDDDSDINNDEGIGRIVVKHEPSDSTKPSKPATASPALRSALKGPAPEKKGVRFSQSLDIAPAEGSRVSEISEDKPKVDPVSDIIVERSGPAKAPAQAAPARKPSRFKRSRDDQPANQGIPKGPFDVPTRMLDEPENGTPTGPEGRTIAETLVERDTASKPVRFDDVDDSMIQAEVADEHQRLRRKFIQREGGFLKEDESPIQPLDESEGGRERVSRFKAARLSRQ